MDTEGGSGTQAYICEQRHIQQSSMGNGWYPDMCPLSKKIQPGGQVDRGGGVNNPIVRHRAASQKNQLSPQAPQRLVPRGL